MTNTEINNIIFTKDENYAYKLRSKLMNAGVRIEYVGNTETLLYFMFNNTKGIVLIDLKYARFASIIKEYTQHQFSRNFCFIYLTDNRSCEIEYDNKLIFVTNYDNVTQTLALANASMERLEKENFTVPESFIDNCSITMLSTLNISSKHAGYEMIKDAIKILVNKHTKHPIRMKEVYAEIGELRGKEPANVEKCIRLALSKAEDKSPEIFKNIFRNERISNTILLHYIAESIRNSYYNSPEYKCRFENAK